MINVLFVCLGNICRSPMAEAVFRDLVKKEELSEQIKIDSAGTGNWHDGKSPHQGTREILEQLKISYEGMKARQVHINDWNNFDYIIAMDEQNISDLKEIRTNAQNVMVARLMDFVKDPETENVPDPYYTGNFNYTYELVSKGCTNLLHSIKQKHNI